MKKVLIITYYWPPAGGPGVQRVLKFAKYLPAFGWQPIILTVKNGEYPAIDETLEEDIPEVCKVYKTKSFEPNLFYKKFVGMNSSDKIPVAVLAEENQNWKKRIANWVRLNLVIPDAKIGWIPFAVKKGKKIIQREKPDAIFSSSPPPTVHLIAQKLARWSRIKWVADFRDPWTDIYYYDESKESPFSKFFDRKLERKILNTADDLITVSENVAFLLGAKKESKKAIKIIPNGYDEADFYDFAKVKHFDEFTLAYAGKMNGQQNPANLWKVLGKLVISDLEFGESFQILLMGNIQDEIINEIKSNHLEQNLKVLGYIGHKSALENLKKSHILLLLIPNTKNNEGIITGKLFEYLAMRKFILGIGPKKGDALKILKENDAGKMFEFSEEENLRKEIKFKYKQWKEEVALKVNEEEIKKYSRYNLTKELINVFEKLSN